MQIKPYQPAMTERQLAFFQALTAPFPDESLSVKPGRGGKPMTWLDKRALENRLDSVCTPLGWTIEYRPTNRGFTSRMGILCPADDGEWVWVYKEDGAGFEEMDSVDDDEKSGYTNALRRVAQDAWGIGRYLYRKGLPSFANLDAQARPELPPYVSPEVVIAPIEIPAPAPQATPEPEPRGRFNDTPSPAPEPPPAPPAPQFAPQPSTSDLDPKYIRIPEAGRDLFGWVKALEDHYQTTIKPGIFHDAEKLGAGRFMAQWSQEVVNEVAMTVIQGLRRKDNYQGEFEAMFKDEVSGNAPPLPARSAAPVGGTGSSASPAPPAPSPTSPKFSDDEIRAAQSKCGAALVAYITEFHGDPKPSPAKCKAFLAEMSPDAENGAGQKGEVMASLGACTDVAWINNLLALILNEVANERRKVQEQAQAAGAEPSVPF